MYNYTTTMTGDLGKKFLKDYLAKTDPLFEKYLRQKISEAGKISNIPVELLERFLATARRGKKIRGSLVVLGYQIAGGKDFEAIYDASLYIELFHAGVLVHDDFMDQDYLRRGFPTLHKQFEELGKKLKVGVCPLHYGESMAVNVGDAAFYLSWEKLLSGDFPPDRLVAAGKIYADYIIRLVHGQILDVTNTTIKSLSENDILKVLKYKSAEYTAVLPLLTGAALGGLEDEKRLNALKEYGLAFGWAFQIQDDVLGLYGDEKKLGKPIGSDLREGKNTLFMLHLAKVGNAKQRAFQRQVLGNPKVSKKDVLRMREVLEESGSYQYVIDLGWKYVENGKKIIPQITKDKKIREILESLIVYMMERTK